MIVAQPSHQRRLAQLSFEQANRLSDIAELFGRIAHDRGALLGRVRAAGSSQPSIHFYRKKCKPCPRY